MKQVSSKWRDTAVGSALRRSYGTDDEKKEQPLPDAFRKLLDRLKNAQEGA